MVLKYSVSVYKPFMNEPTIWYTTYQDFLWMPSNEQLEPEEYVSIIESIPCDTEIFAGTGKKLIELAVLFEEKYNKKVELITLDYSPAIIIEAIIAYHIQNTRSEDVLLLKSPLSLPPEQSQKYKALKQNLEQQISTLLEVFSNIYGPQVIPNFGDTDWIVDLISKVNKNYLLSSDAYWYHTDEIYREKFLNIIFEGRMHFLPTDFRKPDELSTNIQKVTTENKTALYFSNTIQYVANVGIKYPLHFISSLLEEYPNLTSVISTNFAMNKYFYYHTNPQLEIQHNTFILEVSSRN